MNEFQLTKQFWQKRKKHIWKSWYLFQTWSSCFSASHCITIARFISWFCHHMHTRITHILHSGIQKFNLKKKLAKLVWILDLIFYRIFKKFQVILQDFQAILQDFQAILQEFQAILQDFQAILQDFKAILQDFQTILQDLQTILQDFQAILPDFQTIL